jgi:hypothetical protein
MRPQVIEQNPNSTHVLVWFQRFVKRRRLREDGGDGELADMTSTLRLGGEKVACPSHIRSMGRLFYVAHFTC